MATDAGQSPLPESPLYIRWGPDRSPYAIELKLDLVDRIRRALLDARSVGQEIGGILVGALPTQQAPTLRIEEVEFIARRAEDGATFMLEGGGGERFAEVRRKARARERYTVGLFRSHLRSGPLRPSLADRTLLASEFKDPIYLLLLANGAEPFNAAFFVASNGPLPAEVSAREFNLDPAEFRALPEVEPEQSRRDSRAAIAASHSRAITISVLALVFVAIVSALAYLNQSLLARLWLPQGGLSLAVEPQDGLLRIVWNHNASAFDRTRGATLTIRSGDSTTERSFRLGQDELRLGSVVCATKDHHVEVRLAFPESAAGTAGGEVVWNQR